LRSGDAVGTGLVDIAVEPVLAELVGDAAPAEQSEDVGFDAGEPQLGAVRLGQHQQLGDLVGALASSAVVGVFDRSAACTAADPR
jgi:hypothetical protein